MQTSDGRGDMKKASVLNEVALKSQICEPCKNHGPVSANGQWACVKRCQTEQQNKLIPGSVYKKAVDETNLKYKLKQKVTKTILQMKVTTNGRIPQM
jgi:hypothetical protein